MTASNKGFANCVKKVEVLRKLWFDRSCSVDAYAVPTRWREYLESAFTALGVLHESEHLQDQIAGGLPSLLGWRPLLVG